MDDPITYFTEGFHLKMIQMLKAKFKKSWFPIAQFKLVMPESRTSKI